MCDLAPLPETHLHRRAEMDAAVDPRDTLFIRGGAEPVIASAHTAWGRYGERMPIAKLERKHSGGGRCRGCVRRVVLREGRSVAQGFPARIPVRRGVAVRVGRMDGCDRSPVIE